MVGKALLVDGNSLMYRAYFALPPLDDGRGNPTNAVYGFLSMFLRALADEKPSHALVAFDVHGPTFRHERFADYKGTRPPTPDDLRPQFPIIKEMLRAMGVPVVEKQGYEADDLIGTASRVFSEAGADALIVTGDRDSFQLTGNGVEVLYTKRGISETERVTEQYIVEKYGVRPRQLIDMKALCGDVSDNIPGVPGIGEKTAAKLIAQYGDLEACLLAADAEQKGKLRERLMENAALARECRFLAEIDRNVPVQIDFEAARISELGRGEATLRQYGLKSLASRLARLSEDYRASLSAQSAPASDVVVPTPVSAEPATVVPVRAAPVELTACEAMRQVAERAPEGEEVAVLLTDGRLTVAFSGGAAYALALGGRTLMEPGIVEEDALQSIRPLLQSDRKKVICRAKRLRTMLARSGIAVNGDIYDPSLAQYVLDPQTKSFDAAALLEAEGIAPTAEGLFALRDAQTRMLEDGGLTSLLRDLEEPLSDVLYRMERTGFRADGVVLEELGKTYSARIDQLTASIRAVAGYDINIQSPKQLAVFLFDELRLSTGKRGATARSTNAETLEALSDAHPVVGQILEYRKFAKLNGTYIEGLLRMLRAPGGDGRIHTRFDQTATATGRLSSQEPNLQNIPVRTELGRDIRRAFVASPGCVLVDADYSQIELRVLAHMAGDARMIEAFRSGQDIHRRTASEVFGVPMDSVTGDMRSAAKAVNFGIVYGISEFGLAKNTGLTRTRAAEFIKTYLSRYPAIGAYMRECIEKAKTDGYVTTMLGRRRYIRELMSENRATRSFGERAAMNTPIQGTAADVIKLAMVAVDRALRREGLRSKLILQVHDELILESPSEESAQAASLLKREMEGVLALDAPLRADVSVGGNWYDCK